MAEHRFEIGNRYAQEWTLENALPRFEDALKYAEDDDACLCLQDAIAQTGIPSRSFYELAKNHPVLQSIKQDIAEQIIRRVNRFSLDRISPSPASPAIWRMKQLGEKDQQYVEQVTKNDTKIVVSSDEAAEEIKKLKERFE